MRRRTGLRFAWLFLFSVTLVHAQNPFDAFPQFSATVSGSPLKWEKMKIYRSGNQMRAEYVYENELRIISLADGKGWFIRPRESKPKECGRIPVMDASTYPFFSYSGGDFIVERSPIVDSETLEGHSCKVTNYVVKPKDGGPVTIKLKLWEAEDLKGFPIKIDVAPSSKAKFTMNFTDVSLDRPDPKLFQLPALCRIGTHGKKKPAATAPKTPGKTAPKPQ